MINTSREYKNRIRKSRTFIPRATITLSDSTLLTLDKDDIMQNGLRIDDSVGEKIALGTVNINKCTLILNNFKGKFDTYDFTGAVIRPYSGLQLSETIEYLPKGVFTTNSPNAKNTIVILEALDNMNKFNKEFSGVSISAPCTSLQLLQAVCVYCGVSLATISFLNSNSVVESLPDDETISCREVVGWIAQKAGCFARFNTQGALELKWYDIAAFESEDNLDGGYFDGNTPYSSGDNADGGNFTDYNSGDSFDGGSFTIMDRYQHLYSFNNSPTIGTDDVIITGIQVTDTSETPTTVLYGSSGYVLTIEGNQLIQNSTQAAQIANSVGAKIVGMKIRPFTASAQSDPAMEAGDIGYVSDRKGNSYQTVFTSLSYTIGNYEPISCGTETPAIRGFRATQEMKAIVEARKNAERQLTAYDIAVQQLTSIMTNAMGYYPIRVTQPDGSYIDYMCDKPSLAESQIIWKKSIDGFAVSKDGGTTWITGITADGNIVAQTLSVVGINADWINAGSITSQNGHSTINLNNGTFSLGNARLVWNGTKLSVVGEITASSGKIGPFDISNAGLMSDIMQFFENANQPLIWLTKKGPEGEDWGSEVDGTQRANYEPAVAAVRAVEEGIQTDVYIQARDNLQGDYGVFEIDRFEVSSGMPVSRVKATENGIVFEKYSSGFIEKSFEINLNVGNISMESNGKNFLFSFDDTEGTLSIQADKVLINGHEF